MNKCEESVGRLAECLETLNQSLMEMAAVFRVKRQVLAKADMRALAELFEREETVAEGLFKAEAHRELLAEDVAGMTGAKSTRLVDITEVLPEEQRDLLLTRGMRLKVTMEALVREARIVAMICNAAVDHYEKLIRIISGCGLEAAVYTSSGQKGAGPRRSIIDQAI